QVGSVDFAEKVEVPLRLHGDLVLELPDAVGDIAYHFQLGKINRVYRGRLEVDVHDLGAPVAHEEGGLLHHVVTDVEDQVRSGQGPVYKVVVRQRRVAQEQIPVLIQHALAHLGGDEGDAGLVDKL